MKKALAFFVWISPVLSLILAYAFHEKTLVAASPLCVALIYLGIQAGKLPIVVRKRLKGANGRNWPLYIELDPSAPLVKAVLAQETYEAIHKASPINLIKTRSGKGARDLELMGHEIEVQVAASEYGVNENQYRAKEAQSMTGYKQFKGFSARSIERDMTKRTQAARKWLKRRSIL